MFGLIACGDDSSAPERAAQCLPVLRHRFAESAHPRHRGCTTADETEPTCGPGLGSGVVLDGRGDVVTRGDDGGELARDLLPKSIGRAELEPLLWPVRTPPPTSTGLGGRRRRRGVRSGGSRGGESPPGKRDGRPFRGRRRRVPAGRQGSRSRCLTRPVGARGPRRSPAAASATKLTPKTSSPEHRQGGGHGGLPAPRSRW
jgi:hypothetical protein